MKRANNSWDDIYDVGKFGVLTNEECVELLDRYRNHNDNEAFEKLIKSQFGLVLKIVSELDCQHLKEDLVAEAVLTIIKAIKLWDPKKAKLSTFSYRLIRNRLHDYIIMNGKVIRVPVYIKQPTGINQTRNYDELAKKADFGVVDVYSDVCLNSLNLSTKSVLEDIIERDENDYRRKRCERLLSCLTKDNKDIIMKRFGFFGRVYKIEELAEEYKTSSKAIVERIRRAIRRIREKIINTDGAYCMMAGQ